MNRSSIDRPLNCSVIEYHIPLCSPSLNNATSIRFLIHGKNTLVHSRLVLPHRRNSLFGDGVRDRVMIDKRLKTDRWPTEPYPRPTNTRLHNEWEMFLGVGATCR